MEKPEFISQYGIYISGPQNSNEKILLFSTYLVLKYWLNFYIMRSEKVLLLC